jgi:hypothetical protein
MSNRKSTRKKIKRSSKRRPPGNKGVARHQNATYERSLNLLSDLRRGESPFKQLLKKHHLSSRTARKHLGRDLVSGKRGRPVRASKADRRIRVLMFPRSVGDVPIRTRSSRDATKLSEFFHDRDQLLRNKLTVEDFQTKWRGVKVAGEELFADATSILEMADDDVLKVESLYASTGGAR